ncbi:MAG: hypothetical protein IOD15_09600 [Phycisphaerales bacterium]|jgi:hypothetical protein|nr:hypothetical protein [Phycisphaerales bacterium]
MKTVDPSADEEGMPPMGGVDDIVTVLARFNTGPDGSGGGKHAQMGMVLMHGPGMVVEMSAMTDQVRQLMVTMTDEDFAFPVLQRMCRENRWTLMDPESGQRLRF